MVCETMKQSRGVLPSPVANSVMRCRKSGLEHTERLSSAWLAGMAAWHKCQKVYVDIDTRLHSGLGECHTRQILVHGSTAHIRQQWLWFLLPKHQTCPGAELLSGPASCCTGSQTGECLWLWRAHTEGVAKDHTPGPLSWQGATTGCRSRAARQHTLWACIRNTAQQHTHLQKPRRAPPAELRMP